MFVVIGLIASIPKEVWIIFGVLAAVALLAWLGNTVVRGWQKHRAEVEEQQRKQRAAAKAAAKRKLLAELGEDNFALVEVARAAVARVKDSEAARDGWLGEVDFSDDITTIIDNFRKAHALREVADKLSKLDSPTPEDRRLLADAKATAARLEMAGIERVELVDKCAAEAGSIDESLRKERQDARTAQQRAELHGKLSGMLYGIAAAPDTSSIDDSAANRVMAHVAAYREVKKQIEQARRA